MKRSIGYRIFLVCGDEALPLTKTGFEDFVFRGRRLLPAFAGRTVDVATVVCKVENKKPKEIVRIYCQRFKVKSDGSMDSQAQRTPRVATLGNGTSNQQSAKDRPATVNDAAASAQVLARSLVMISSTAQKKIFDALWR